MTAALSIAALVAEKMRWISAHRERLVEAWVAETGIHPSEAELVESTDGLTTTISIRRGPAWYRNRERQLPWIFGWRLFWLNRTAGRSDLRLDVSCWSTKDAIDRLDRMCEEWAPGAYIRGRAA